MNEQKLQKNKREAPEDLRSTDKKNSGIGSLVAHHYNTLEEKGLQERSYSRIFYMRNFNNWIKSYIITKHLEKVKEGGYYKKINVLDIGCGKGGDLLKWYKSYISHLICVDIANTSVTQCKSRYDERRHSSRACLKKNGGKKFENEVFKIELQSDCSASPLLFGNKYNFFLEGVVDCPEFLVHFPTLERLCAKYGLEFVYKQPFDEVYADAKNNRESRNLMFKMQTLEVYPPLVKDSSVTSTKEEYSHCVYACQEGQQKVKTMSKSEWEAISSKTMSLKDSVIDLKEIKDMVMTFSEVDLLLLLQHDNKGIRSKRKCVLQYLVLENVRSQNLDVIYKIKEIYKSNNERLSEDIVEIDSDGNEAQSIVRTPKSRKRKNVTQPRIKFKNLPFYDIVDVLLEPSVLGTKGFNHYQEAHLSFSLSAKQIKILSEVYDCDSDEGGDNFVHLRMCLVDQSEEHDDYLPLNIFIKVNKRLCPLPNPVSVSRRSHPEQKRPPGPINITDYCILKPYTLNVLQDIDGEIAMTSLPCSLLCPLGKMRMILPCKSKNCNHVQCFDASLFLQMNERKSTWTCPVCNEYASYYDLIIDGYFEDVLSVASECNNIFLNFDGSWVPVNSNCFMEMKKEEAAKPDPEIETLSDSSSSSNSNSSSSEGSNSSSDSSDSETSKEEERPARKKLKANIIEVITLSDSDTDTHAAPNTYTPQPVYSSKYLPFDNYSIIESCLPSSGHSNEPTLSEDEKGNSSSGKSSPSLVCLDSPLHVDEPEQSAYSPYPLNLALSDCSSNSNEAFSASKKSENQQSGSNSETTSAIATLSSDSVAFSPFTNDSVGSAASNTFEKSYTSDADSQNLIHCALKLINSDIDSSTTLASYSGSYLQSESSCVEKMDLQTIVVQTNDVSDTKSINSNNFSAVAFASNFDDDLGDTKSGNSNNSSVTEFASNFDSTVVEHTQNEDPLNESCNAHISLKSEILLQTSDNPSSVTHSVSSGKASCNTEITWSCNTSVVSNNLIEEMLENTNLKINNEDISVSVSDVQNSNEVQVKAEESRCRFNHNLIMNDSLPVVSRENDSISSGNGVDKDPGINFMNIHKTNSIEEDIKICNNIHECLQESCSVNGSAVEEARSRISYVPSYCNSSGTAEDSIKSVGTCNHSFQDLCKLYDCESDLEISYNNSSEISSVTESESVCLNFESVEQTE